MDNEVSMKEEDAVARHCAYCLQLCGFPAKLCGGCKKRAYCSKDCQVKDWSSKGPGQRHVNWCRRHECGEEDVDWEVVPVENKGLGIRAKKLIPAGLKIIVEPVFFSQNEHPGKNDLEGATLEKKFFVHSFTSVSVDESTPLGVALRIARVNHACQPNASKIYDTTTLVTILYALKDIHPGEEITICYSTPCFDLRPFSRRLIGLATSSAHWSHISIEEEFSMFRELLFSAYGIVCPSHCFCYDPSTLALVREGRQIQSTIDKLAIQNKIEEALEAGEKLIGILQRLNVSWEPIGDMNYNLFRIAVRKSETLPGAMSYMRSAVELYQKICPYSEQRTKKLEKLLQCPQLDPDYLLLG